MRRRWRARAGFALGNREPVPDDNGMGTLEIDEQTHGILRFAARVFGVTEAEVVSRLLAQYASETEGAPAPRPERDPWDPVPVYGEYDGRRVDGLYLPATKRLTVSGDPLPGSRFKSPSGAARAVVSALNPGRSAAQTNGWRFWRLAETDERLEVLR